MNTPRTGFPASGSPAQLLACSPLSGKLCEPAAPRATEAARARSGMEPIVLDATGQPERHSDGRCRHSERQRRISTTRCAQHAASRSHACIPQSAISPLMCGRRAASCGDEVASHVKGRIPHSGSFRNPQSAFRIFLASHKSLATSHSSRRLPLVFALLLALGAQPALGTPYEVLYDANVDGVFPEDEGWVRITSAGGANRTVENGILTLDGLACNQISDQYRWNAMETLDPDPGEMFYAEWRMRLLPGSEDSDVGVFIATDAMQRAFNLQYSVFGMRSSQDDREVNLDMTVLHRFRMESLDMVDYVMYVDDDLVWDGAFVAPAIFSSRVNFGDRFIGAASASEWDYFRFGVVAVPEPSTLFLVGYGVCTLHRRRWRKETVHRMEDWPCTELPYS